MGGCWLLWLKLGKQEGLGGTSSVLRPFIAMARRSRPSSMCTCLAEEQRHAVAIAPWLYVPVSTRPDSNICSDISCHALFLHLSSSPWMSDVGSVEVVGFASMPFIQTYLYAQPNAV